MKYLSKEHQTEYLPNFRGERVHNPVMTYSVRREHEVTFYYHKKGGSMFPGGILKTSTYFTSKKKAKEFIKLTNL